jgi:lipopolysaccharide transport system ATP-binding protein
VIKTIGKAGDVAEEYIRNMREEMNEEHRKFTRVPETFSAATQDNPTASEIETETVFKTSEEFDARVATFRYGSGGAKISFVELLDERGCELVYVDFDQVVQIKIYFISHLNTAISPIYYIVDDKKILILGTGPRQIGAPLLEARDGDRFVVTYKTRIPLREGIYSIQFQLTEPVALDETAKFLDVIDNAIVFRVNRRQRGRIWAKVFIPNTIEIKSV